MTTVEINPNAKKKAKTLRATDPFSAILQSYYNAAPLTGQAQSVSSAQIASEVAGTKAAYALQQKQLREQQERAQGFSLALAKLTAPDPEAITGRYQEAADRLRAYGTGLTGAVQEAQQTEADRTRAAVTDVLGSASNVHGYDPEALRNAAQMTNIVNPGRTLESEAAAAGATAAYGRAANAASISDIANQYGQKLSDVDTELSGKLAAIQATRGEKYNAALQAAQSSRRDDYSLISDLLNKQFQQGMDVKKFNQDASQFGARLNLDYQQLAQTTLNNNRDYAIALQGMGYKAQDAKLKALALETKLQNGGLTTEQALHYKADAASIAKDAFNNKLKVGQAMAQMREGFVDAKGKSNGQIPPSIALDALVKAGYKHLPRKWLQASMSNLGGQNPFSTTSGASPDNSVAAAASSFLGVPYKWGGTSITGGLDCSAFAQALLAKFNIKIPRTTYTQFRAGTAVPLTKLQPGDLVFTRPGKNGPNHVGVYIGDGQIQQSPHTGDVNKITPLSDFLAGGFVGARRYR